MLRIKRFVFNPFGENTYLAWDDTNNEAAIIDPGMTDEAERRLLAEFIEANRLKVTQIINTHLHLDHCFGDNYVKEKYGAQIKASPLDGSLGASVDTQASMFGLHIDPKYNVTTDVPLHDGDTLSIGAYTFEVIAVPGHSPGGIALYCPEARIAFVGDSIFAGGIGRTDLPGGDYDTLIEALRTQVLSLPPETQLLPGHDRPTTVAAEASTNPYLR